MPVQLIAPRPAGMTTGVIPEVTRVATGQVAVSAPVNELLVWVAARERTYAETMAAWRSSCPRYTPWEDALDAALVQVVSGRGADGDGVRLTPLGLDRLTGLSGTAGRTRLAGG